MKPKICIVSSSALPIPAVKGGAVESLVNLLCEDNEIEKKLDITVITIANESAILEQGRYRSTHFINFPSNGKGLTAFFWRKLHGLVRHVLGHAEDTVYPYERKVFKFLRRNYQDYNLIVSEAGSNNIIERLADRYGNSCFCLHLHGPLQADKHTEKAYKYVIAVSIFIKRKY